MNYKKIFELVKKNITAIAKQNTQEGKELWANLLEIHPADIAQLISDLNKDNFLLLFQALPDELKIETFEYLTDSEKAFVVVNISDEDKNTLFKHTSMDDLIDLFEHLSHSEIQHVFGLLQKKEREQALSLMRFEPESAGGIMDINVISLQKDFTTEKSSRMLQHLKPKQDLHRQLYVTDKDNKLVGHINLEDLVLNKPQERIETFLRENDFVANLYDDQERIAHQMSHYKLITIPVVSDENYFFGVIANDTLIEVIEEEATEDMYKISALTPIKQTYFETSFFKLVYERSYILVILLLVESFSSTVLEAHESALAGLAIFIPMLVSTGGNTSSQTSALAIQGLTSGEVNFTNIFKFLRREILMALVIASILGITAFIRVFYLAKISLVKSAVISLTLGSIVMTSVVLGSGLPMLLKKLKMDPAFSAGPFLATLMDILGIVFFCYISKLFLT